MQTPQYQQPLYSDAEPVYYPQSQQQQQRQQQQWQQQQLQQGAQNPLYEGLRTVESTVASKNPLSVFFSRKGQRGLRSGVNFQNFIVWLIVGIVASIVAIGLLISYFIDMQSKQSYLVGAITTFLLLALPMFVIAISNRRRSIGCRGSVADVAIPGQGRVARGLRAGQRAFATPTE